MKILDFSDIISHVKPGEKPEEYQAVIMYENPNYNPHNELRIFFYGSLYSGISYNRKGIFSFLNFHYVRFGGDKTDFIDFIKKEIQPKRVLTFCPSIIETNIIPANDIIFEWIKEKEVSKREHYHDKYYAWYHKILIALGKENQFTPGAKKEIVALGKNRYGAKSGFYQKFIDFDIEKKNSFVSGLPPRERNKWKSIITEISNSDIDVIKYLENFPN